MTENINQFFSLLSENLSTISQILIICRILGGVRAKKTRGSNIICRTLHTQRGDGANTTRLWPIQRNRRSHNDAIKEHESKKSAPRMETHSTSTL